MIWGGNSVKTLLAILCAVLLTLAPQARAFGENGSETDYSFTITDGQAMITGYQGAGGDVTVPGTLGGAPVTRIGANAFSQQKAITGLTLPEGVISLEAGALYGCTAMARVTLPESLAYIGGRAFGECSGLAAIIIPAGVKEILPLAFYTGTLTDITVETGNTRYEAVDGVLFDKIEKVLHSYPARKTEDTYTVPDGTLGIGDSAFFTCYNLTRIVLPQGLTTIGQNAFYSCNGMKGIVLPASLTAIGAGAFAYSPEMRDIVIPRNVVSIGYGAFTATHMDKIVLEEGNAVYETQNGVLYDKVHGILHTYPNKKAGATYKVPDGTNDIADYAFMHAFSLKSVNLPASVVSMGRYAFGYCTGLTDITLPPSLKILEQLVFYCCSSLTGMEVPEGVTEIKQGAFSSCTALESAVLPDSAALIEYGVFDGCAKVVIHASDASYAHQYAVNNNIPFAAK
jgi:hypothetical protein